MQYKKRTIDYGNGTQYVELNSDGIVTRQWIASNGNHYYTGDGNPEIVGKKESFLRGMGFKKVASESENDMLIQWSISKDYDEHLQN